MVCFSGECSLKLVTVERSKREKTFRRARFDLIKKSNLLSSNDESQRRRQIRKVGFSFLLYILLD